MNNCGSNLYFFFLTLRFIEIIVFPIIIWNIKILTLSFVSKYNNATYIQLFELSSRLAYWLEIIYRTMISF